jgi:hypothetical protein
MSNSSRNTHVPSYTFPKPCPSVKFCQDGLGSWLFEELFSFLFRKRQYIQVLLKKWIHSWALVAHACNPLLLGRFMV